MGTAAQATNPSNVAKPIVIGRSHFKQDAKGYLTATSRGQLYLFTLNTKKLEATTSD